MLAKFKLKATGIKGANENGSGNQSQICDARHQAKWMGDEWAAFLEG